MKPNQKRHQKAAVVVSPEEQAKIEAARLKAAEEAKAEKERIEALGRNVKTMSHRQLCAEINRTLIKREYVKVGLRQYAPQPGLNIAFGTVLLTVLENTKTPSNIFETDEFGRPTRVGRLDQINQLGIAHAITGR